MKGKLAAGNKVFHAFILGEENSPGWLCGEDEGRTMAPLWCPLLACHMPVFATKSPERKVSHLPTLQNSDHKTRDVSLTCVLNNSTPDSLKGGHLFGGYVWMDATKINIKDLQGLCSKMSVNTGGMKKMSPVHVNQSDRISNKNRNCIRNRDNSLTPRVWGVGSA